MNWADLSFIVTALACALVGNAAALDAKMGWGAGLFAVGGLAVGVGFGLVGRQLGLLILFAGCKQSRSVVAFGLLLAYMLVPMIALIGACAATARLTVWVAAHFV